MHTGGPRYSRALRLKNFQQMQKPEITMGLLFFTVFEFLFLFVAKNIQNTMKIEVREMFVDNKFVHNGAKAWSSGYRTRFTIEML